MHSIQFRDMHIYRPTVLENYLHASVKSCNVCAFIAFWKKITIKKVHFSQFLKGPLQFIKITLHSMISTFTVCMRFLKNRVNFTRSCAFAQKVKFYTLQMLKKQNLTHPKAAKLATLDLIDLSTCMKPDNTSATASYLHEMLDDMAVES